ncbi:MAG TPA: hypothetical protein VNN13_07980 [Methylomirabilota bacterium]|nr:hypothetical protein [Methylomirabilota bacterium]
MNFDRHEPPIVDQMKWLCAAGFKDVQCFWQDEQRALFGGFNKQTLSVDSPATPWLPDKNVAKKPFPPRYGLRAALHL